jgi:hypothetical protein
LPYIQSESHRLTNGSLYFSIRHFNAQGQAGAVRSGCSDCLTESGIVWLSVALRMWQNLPPRHATENHYEAPEGVSAHPERTAPAWPFCRTATIGNMAFPAFADMT